MQISDVIADMLTRIRNASNAKHETVDVPASNMKKAIADILLEEGYIKAVSVIEDGKQGVIRITLKYDGKAKVIHVVGGGTKDHFLSQMTADACGIPVAAGPEEATAIGNLLVQLMAAGEAKDLADARAIVAASFTPKYYEPQDTATWDAAYKTFCALN